MRAIRATICALPLCQLAALVVDTVLQPGANMAPQQHRHHIHLDLFQPQRARLEQRILGQVAHHVEKTVHARVDTALLPEDQLQEVGLVQGVALDQIFQDVEMTGVVEEYLRLDAPFPQPVSRAFGVVKGGERDFARPAAAARCRLRRRERSSDRD